MKTPEKLKILLLGDSFVGKSTLVNILRKKKQQKYSPTIFDNIYHYLDIDDISYELDIRDTSGAPEYSNLITSNLRDIDVAIVCFAVDNRVSFYNVKAYWLQKVSHVPIILLGLKIDLRYNQDNESAVKIISYQEGKDLATSLGMKYLEFCQTKDEKQQLENIEAIFKLGFEFMKVQQNSKNEKSKSNKKCLIL